MMRTIRGRITVMYITLVTVMVMAIWGVNHWYLETYYINEKIASLNEAYAAIDEQIALNEEAGLSIADAMKQEQDADGNKTEGNLRRLVREFSDRTNVSILMVDNRDSQTALYSTARDAQFLKERVDRYIFGQNKMNFKVLEEYENYKIQQTFDPWREGMYLESWGFFSDNSTAFIMSTPLSSIRESVDLSNRFLAYVGVIVMASGAIAVYFLSKKMTGPINEISELSEKMSDLEFNVKYEPTGHEVEELRVLGNSMNILSEKLRDTIGELKAANIQLQKDIEEKTRIDEMRKDFIANVSHELKTPIALIQGYAEGLQEGMAEEKESRDYYCEVIVDEAGKMNKMVKQLLTLSSLESGNDRTVMERFDLVELIQGVIGSARILLEQNEITVKFEAESPIYVWADEFKIEEVVTNYLSNAIHHAGGEKMIVIRITSEAGRTRVSVFNTGTPIPEEAIPNLWTKFYKVDKARTRAYGGSGIGLSIVKAIVEGHGQECGVENWENGVEFWFTLDSKDM